MMFNRRFYTKPFLVGLWCIGLTIFNVTTPLRASDEEVKTIRKAATEPSGTLNKLIALEDLFKKQDFYQEIGWNDYLKIHDILDPVFTNAQTEAGNITSDPDTCSRLCSQMIKLLGNVLAVFSQERFRNYRTDAGTWLQHFIDEATRIKTRVEHTGASPEELAKARADLDALRRQQEAAQKRIDELLRNIARLTNDQRAELARLQNEQRERQERINILEAQLRASEATGAAQATALALKGAEIDRQAAEIVRLRTALDRMDSTITRLNAELATLTATQAGTEAERARLERELAARTAELAKRTQEREELNAQLKTAKETIKQLEKDLADLHEQLKQEIARHTQDVEDLAKVVTDLKKQLEALTQRGLEKNREFTEALRQLTEKNTLLEEKHAKLQKELAELKQSFDAEKERHAAEVTRLTNERDQRDATIVELKATISNLKAELTTLRSTTTAAAEEFNQKIADLEKQLADEKSTLATTQGELKETQDKLKTTEAALTEIRQQKAELEKLLKETRKKLALTRFGKAAWMIATTFKEQRLKKTLATTRHLFVEKEAEKTRADTAEAARDTLRATLTKAQSDLAIANTTGAERQTMITDLSAQLASARTENEGLRRRITTLEDANSQLTADLATANERIKELGVEAQGNESAADIGRKRILALDGLAQYLQHTAELFKNTNQTTIQNTPKFAQRSLFWVLMGQTGRRIDAIGKRTRLSKDVDKNTDQFKNSITLNTFLNAIDNLTALAPMNHEPGTNLGNAIAAIEETLNRLPNSTNKNELIAAWSGREDREKNIPPGLKIRKGWETPAEKETRLAREKTEEDARLARKKAEEKARLEGN